MIEYERLRELVSGIKGTSFAGLSTLTQVKLPGGKKNSMQGRVQKVMENANVIIYSNSSNNGYAEMVKKRMLNEGKDPNEFQLKPRAWGTRIGNSPFIEHNGKHYFECMFISPGTVTYLLDGKPVDKSEIEGLEIEKEKSEAYEASQGGIEEKVVLRTFALESITKLKIRNEELNG